MVRRECRDLADSRVRRVLGLMGQVGFQGSQARVSRDSQGSAVREQVASLASQVRILARLGSQVSQASPAIRVLAVR